MVCERERESEMEKIITGCVFIFHVEEFTYLNNNNRKQMSARVDGMGTKWGDQEFSLKRDEREMFYYGTHFHPISCMD